MKILIATDGSEFSMAAARECCSLFGNRPGTSIKVISVYEEIPIIATEPFALPPEYYQQMAEAANKQAMHFAEETVSMLKANCGDVEISTEVLLGKPSSRIVDLANEWGADVIVVGSHGRGFWGRLIGSVSNSVLHHAHCSVLVVRPQSD